MRGHWMDERWNRWVVLLVAFAAWACADGGEGCDTSSCLSCDGEAAPPADPYPAQGQRIQGGAHVRVNQSVLNVVSQNIDPLLESALGEEGLSFCVPPTQETILFVTVRLCHRVRRCDDGTTGCQLQVGLNNPSLRFLAGNAIQFRGSVALNDSLPFQDGNCRLNLSTSGAGMPVTANIRLVPAATGDRLVAIRLAPADVSLNTNALNINASSCGFLGTILNLFSGIVRGQIEGLVRDQVAALASDLPDRLGTEGALSLGNLLGGLLGGEGEGTVLEGDDASGLLNYLFYAAGYADAITDTALDLGFVGGFTAEPDLCVPLLSPPNLGNVPKSETLTSGRRPSGAAFGVGVALHQRLANLALWGVHRSGALCLDLDADTIDALSTGLLGLALPSLGDMAEGENRPIRIELRPQAAPTVAFGRPTGLIEVRLNDVDLHFYAFVRERFARAFTLNVDIALGLNLEVTPAGEIAPVLGDMSQLLRRVEARNLALVSPAEAEILTGLAPVFIELLLPGLSEGLIDPIALPDDLFGLRIVFGPDSFASIDGNSRLGVFLNLAAAPAPQPMRIALEPVVLAQRHERASAADLRAYLQEVRAARAPMEVERLAGRLVLEMGEGRGLDARELEFSWRWAGEGLWSAWQAGPQLVVASPRLALTGRHRVEVRARLAGLPESVGASVAQAEVLVDIVAPHVRLQAGATEVLVVAADDLSPVDAMEARYRLGEGGWSAWSGLEPVPLAGFAGQRVWLEVEVRDEAGNVRAVREELLVPEAPLALRGSDLRPQDAPGCSALSGDAGSSGPWGLLALLALVVGARRRARWGALVASLAFFLSACSFSDSSVTTSCSTDENCAEGQVCEGGLCVAGCSDASPCPSGERCQDARCVPDLPGFCRSDADCGEREICRALQCVPAPPPPCAQDQDCGAGQICEAGQCGPAQCSVPADCGIGARCVGGRCEPLVPDCTQDSDCGEGEVCEAGACVPGPEDTCDTDADCDEDEVCEAGLCVPGPEDTCDTDADCDEDEVCEAGVCVPGPDEACLNDGDCAPGERCVRGTCEPDPSFCARDSDCGAGLVCRTNACVPFFGCRVSADCVDGEVCDEGVCRPTPVACDATRPCEGLALCVQGACVPVACFGDDDCGEGERCVGFLCEPSAPLCTDDEACGDGPERCIRGRCVMPVCGEDLACDAPFACSDGICALAPCVDDAGCLEGEICDGGVCTPPVACRNDAACGAACPGQVGRCEGGACVCEEACPATCPTGTFCCAERGRCRALPWPCEGLSCPAGTRATVTEEPRGNAAACTVTNPGVCACEPLEELPLGNWGRWAALAADPALEVIAIAAYNETYGDLMVGLVQDDGSVDWAWVDGVPSGVAPTGALGGPRGGVALPGEDTGWRPSIAVDAEGVVHVAYQLRRGERGAEALRYARGAQGEAGWTWTTMTIDDRHGAGRSLALALDAEGRPVIAYSAPRAGTRSLPLGELRIARATSAAPDAAGWVRETALTGPTLEPCGVPCPSGTRCALDAWSCEATLRASWCGGCAAGEACFVREADGAFSYRCAGVGEEGLLRRVDSGPGAELAWGRLASGHLGLAMYDGTFGNLLWLTVAPDGARTGALVLDGERIVGDDRVDTGDLGRFPAVGVAPNGDVLVAYTDGGGRSLYVRNITAGTRTLVDDGLRPRGSGVESTTLGQPLFALIEGQLWLQWHNATRHVLEGSLRQAGGWRAPEVLVSSEGAERAVWAFQHGVVAGERGVVRMIHRLLVGTDGRHERVDLRLDWRGGGE